MKHLSISAFSAVALLAALGAAPACAQQEQGRVISSTPMRAADGSVSYSVTYEYAGRRYTTRTDAPPGDTMAVQVSPLGVTTATASGMATPTSIAPAAAAPWQHVAPEPGVVVGAPAVNTYAQPVVPAPVYAPVYAPAPVYVAPSYGYGYGYGYGYPSASYPPFNLSLNLGYVYSRGGGRGWRWR